MAQGICDIHIFLELFVLDGFADRNYLKLRKYSTRILGAIERDSGNKFGRNRENMCWFMEDKYTRI